MQGLHSVLGNMGINLRGGQVTMPQQQLHNPEVRAVIEQVGRKGMS